jgi:aspartokinase
MKRCRKVLSGLNIPEIDKIDCYDELSLVALVGRGIERRKGIAARIFDTVTARKINIRMISYGASGTALYFLVDRRHRSAAIRALHSEFFEKD